MSRRTSFAVLASLLMVGMALSTPVAADDGSFSVSVTQDSSGQVVVSVTHNGSGVANATVTVEVTDENKTYAGAGTHTTDGNGTLTLSEPSETVNVSVTAEKGNLSATTTAQIAPVEEEEEEEDGNAADNFGLRVSSFVQDLQSDDGNETDAPLGVLVANFVLANNPGDPPAHAGPPAWLLNGTDEHPGQGPPAHAGPPNGTDNGPPNGTDHGPPEHAGPPDDEGKDRCEDDNPNNDKNC